MRQLIYDVLSTVVAGGAGSRVFQGEAMLEAPRRDQLPCLVYRLGNDTSERLGQGQDAHRQFFQVYIHDKPADYSLIDQIKNEVKAKLAAAAPAAFYNVLDIAYVETSRDLDDEYLQTIVRYVRFEATLSR